MSNAQRIPLDSRLEGAMYVEPEGSQYRSTRRLQPGGYNIPKLYLNKKPVGFNLHDKKINICLPLTFVLYTQCHVFFRWGSDVAITGVPE